MTPRARALVDWARTYLEIEADPAYIRERLRAFAQQHGYEPGQVERAVDNAIKHASKESAAA